MGSAVKIIEENSLQVLPDGYSFNVRLNWYRSLPISSLVKIAITLDGEPVPSDQIRFEINNRVFRFEELGDQVEEFWFVQDSLRLHILQPGKVAVGESHTIDAELALRFPYIAIGPGQFLTNTSHSASTQVAQSGYKGPIFGVTLFSFTNEWQQRLYDLDSMIARVAELGLGPGLEVVGFQSFRTYPSVSDEEAYHFRRLIEKYKLIPTCLGANMDNGRNPKHLMSEEEIYSYTERQLISAKKLGFPLMRVPPAVGSLSLEKILPLAEKYQVILAVELHSPLSIYNPEVIHLREMFDRLQSPYLGFIPDFSTTMTSVPEGYWANLRQAGAPEGLIDAAKAIWITDDPIPAKFGALAEASQRFEANPAVSGQINMSMTMFGHAPVDSWREIMPYTRHVHGKYYYVNDQGVEPSIPYAALMKMLKEERYAGTISAEWEGQAFTEEPIGFQQVAAWNAMCKRYLGQ